MNFQETQVLDLAPEVLVLEHNWVLVLVLVWRKGSCLHLWLKGFIENAGLDSDGQSMHNPQLSTALELRPFNSNSRHATVPSLKDLFESIDNHNIIDLIIKTHLCHQL